jgi:hypothetical protein
MAISPAKPPTNHHNQTGWPLLAIDGGEAAGIWPTGAGGGGSGRGGAAGDGAGHQAWAGLVSSRSALASRTAWRKAATKTPTV